MERTSADCRKSDRTGRSRSRNCPARQSGLYATGALLETAAAIAGIEAHLFPPAKSLCPVPCAAGVCAGRLDELILHPQGRADRTTPAINTELCNQAKGEHCKLRRERALGLTKVWSKGASKRPNADRLATRRCAERV